MTSAAPSQKPFAKRKELVSSSMPCPADASAMVVVVVLVKVEKVDCGVSGTCEDVEGECCPW